MDFHLEIAKRHLAKHEYQEEATFRGVPVSKFNKDELMKIINIFAKHIESKNQVMKAITG